MKTIAVTHKNMDFDGLASLSAAVLLFPDTQPVVPKTINPNVKAFLSLHKDVFPWYDRPTLPLARVECLIVVDAADWNRLQGIQELERRDDLQILVWDHHPQAASIRASRICQAKVGANITLMLRDIKADKLDISPIMATLFLTGLYEDTGQLTFSNTTAEDARAAATLLDWGADLAVVNRFLRPAYGEKQKTVLFEMLKHAQRRKINGHRISISKLPINGHIDSLAVVVGMFREIMNVDAAFGVFCLIDNGKCMVIGRSDSEAFNMGDIMRSLGGGGHPGAGSALVREVNPDAIVELIGELIAGNQQASVQISDLMSFPVHSIDPETTMQEVARLLRIKGCTGLPVIDNGHLAGIISRRDFAKVHTEKQMQKPVKTYMRREVVSIEPGKSPQRAAQLMIHHDIGRLPVVENDRVIGIVTRSDVMHYFYDLLPN